MSVQDMIKKSVLESGMFSQYDIPKILAALAVALILGSVIYLVYQKFYVGVIFSRSFAVTLVGMTVLTCMVTLAISSNIVISLGMVGALSIVRFRTAIKDPMDLLYLFWAITSGITAGAGMYALTLLTAVIIILMITLFVRAKPCLPLWSFSLIRKTELWKTNKPPAMQVSQHCFSLQKKTSGGIINVGSPTALIYTGGIHMDNNSLSHTKWNCKYHIVFAPKYRRKVAYGKIKQDIADILSMLCKRKGVKIVEAEICPDHVHMLVEIPPSISVSYFVGYLKGKSTLMIFERHANLKYKYGNRHFWCRGYYVDTVGKNAKKIQEYIANQLQDDLEYDQMTLKEYIDPFTGEPVKRNK